MIYRVIDKATGATVYEYSADAPIEWVGMEFSTHEHVVHTPVNITDVIAIVDPRISKLQYMERFTEQEMATIFSAAKTSPAVEVWLEKFRLSEFIDLSDERIKLGLQALENAGILAAGRSMEILNGN